MAALPGDRLTEAYRAQQVRNAAQLAARVQRQFRGVTIGSPASGRNFLDAAVPLVRSANRESSRLAVTYLQALQTLESQRTMPTSVDPAPALPEEQVFRSLAITGPGAYERRMAKVRNADTPAGNRDRAQAQQVSGRAVVGAAVRHAMNGGRETTRLYIHRDGQAKAYVRITAGDTRVCYYCAMLASRINWKKDSFEESDAQFEAHPFFDVFGEDDEPAKVHDSCRCILRPVYSGALPDSVLEYQRMWKDMSGGSSDPLTNFRRNYEGRGEPGSGSQREVA